MAVLLALLFLFPVGELAAQARFSDSIPDLPLMEGLVEDAEAVVFDKPSGRIVETTARGRLARPAVEAFYSEALPAFGWQPAGPGRFQRESESLILSFRSEGEVLLVRFVLSPDG